VTSVFKWTNSSTAFIGKSSMFLYESR